MTEEKALTRNRSIGSGAPPKSPTFWIDCAQNEPSARARRPRTVTARGVGGLGAERGDVCLRHVADLVTLPASAPYRLAIARASSAPAVRIMNRPLDQFPPRTAQIRPRMPGADGNG